MKGKSMPSDAAARTALRLRVHAGRCARLSGKRRFEAARGWLLAEVAEADRFATADAWTSAAAAVESVARELNARKGAHSDDDAE